MVFGVRRAAREPGQLLEQPSHWRWGPAGQEATPLQVPGSTQHQRQRGAARRDAADCCRHRCQGGRGHHARFSLPKWTTSRKVRLEALIRQRQPQAADVCVFLKLWLLAFVFLIPGPKNTRSVSAVAYPVKLGHGFSLQRFFLLYLLKSGFIAPCSSFNLFI